MWELSPRVSAKPGRSIRGWRRTGDSLSATIACDAGSADELITFRYSGEVAAGDHDRANDPRGGGHPRPAEEAGKHQACDHQDQDSGVRDDVRRGRSLLLSR